MTGSCTRYLGARNVPGMDAADRPGTGEVPELRDLVCFDLYAASRAVTAAYRPILAELGLTYPQYLVLAVLWERDHRPIKDLAAALRLDHATLTPLLRRLELAGLVTRRRSAGDERSVVVALTGQGRGVERRAAVVRSRIAEAIGLGPDEVEALQGVLRRVVASTQAHAVR